MFGGGAKKEKKDEEEDRGENSGSAKAQAAKAAEENPEADEPPPCALTSANKILNRTKHQSLRIFTSSLSSVSPRKSRSRPTRSLRSKFSRCAQSFSSSTQILMNGRSVELVMLGC